MKGSEFNRTEERLQKYTLFYKDTFIKIPFMRAPTSLPDHLPNAQMETEIGVTLPQAKNLLKPRESASGKAGFPPLELSDVGP